MVAGVNVSFPGMALELLFGLVTVFLFFAPTLFNWGWESYIGCLFFAALAIIVVRLRAK
jgi:hypothetical protein